MSEQRNHDIRRALFETPPRRPPREHYGLNAWGGASPKAGRSVLVYSDLENDHWILVEADPSITRFRERPLKLFFHIGGRDIAHTPHMLVQYKSGRVAVRHVTYAYRAKEESALLRAERMWCEAEGFEQELWTEVRIRERPIYISNWKSIVSYLGAARDKDTDQVEGNVLDLCRHRALTIREIERLVTAEPTLARAAIFRLLQQGRVALPALEREPLNVHLRVECTHAR